MKLRKCKFLVRWAAGRGAEKCFSWNSKLLKTRREDGEKRVTVEGVDWRELLVAEGFDGVEFGGFDGRPYAKDKTHTDADGNAGGGGPERNDAGPPQGEADQEDEEIDEDQGNEAARPGEGHGLEKELPGDIAVLGTDGFANSDFTSAFGDADEHDVHDADAANEQADRTQNHGGKADLVDDLVIFGRNLLGGGEREIVSSAIGDIAPALHHFADLIKGLPEHAGVGLGAEIDLVGGRIDLLESVVGDEDAPGRFVGAKPALLFFEDADHHNFGALNEDVLADGLPVGEKNGSHIFADENHL